MPVTPFHFGVGLLGKGLAPRRLSVSAFVASQFVIDCESGYYLLIVRQWPIHRWMHTFALGSAVGLVVGVAVWAIVREDRSGAWPWISADCALGPSLLGGFFGGVTHPFLDGIMHWDIRPLRPFLDGNPLLGLVGLGMLHLLCVLAAVLGVALLVARRSSLP